MTHLGFNNASKMLGNNSKTEALRRMINVEKMNFAIMTWKKVCNWKTEFPSLIWACLKKVEIELLFTTYPKFTIFHASLHHTMSKIHFFCVFQAINFPSPLPSSTTRYISTFFMIPSYFQRVYWSTQEKGNFIRMLILFHPLIELSAIICFASLLLCTNNISLRFFYPKGFLRQT